MIRRPVVAGQFYPASKKTLENEVNGFLSAVLAKEDAIGVVSPHAGYMYSGPVAGKVLGSIKPKETYIIMGPNHTGTGAPFSLDTSNAWQTPLGDVAIEDKLAKAILSRSKYIEEDSGAHAGEHSIEVQLPFLMVLNKDFKFVPIVISYADIETYKAIGLEIAGAVKGLKLEGRVAIIASSDMTHYESRAEAKKKDDLAIEAILRLDEDELDRRVRASGISMCGYAPACIMLAAAKALGAKSAKLIDYKTSGDASGDYSSVVGYAGIVVI